MTQLAGKGGVSTKKTKQNNAHNEFAPDKWTVDDDPITIRSQNRPTITNHSLKPLMDCRKRVTWPAFVIFPGVGTAYIMCLLLPV